MVLLSHPCVIQYDGNCPLRDYWIKVGKGTQNSHQQSRKADTGQYNFLSLENQLRERVQLTGGGGAECRGWNVRKGGESMMGHLESNNMRNQKLRESRCSAAESVVCASALVCLLLLLLCDKRREREETELLDCKII